MTDVPQRNVAAWIFQGSPDAYDVDQYLSRQLYIYWNCPILADQIQVGAPAFIKRSGPQSGIVAYGEIAELPKRADEVDHPSMLGEDLWTTPQEDKILNVGIRLADLRLTLEDGMIPWRVLSQLPSLLSHPIVRTRTGTVFRLTEHQYAELLREWGPYKPHNSPIDASASEGRRRDVRHFRIERSGRLVAQKKQAFADQHGFLACEVCRFRYDQRYPSHLAEGFIEVHHVRPLAELGDETITRLDDLMCICANCHRMVHRTQSVEQNLQDLVSHFAR